jgi:hypothetical protein
MDSFQGNLAASGDFSVSGTATATVNGVSTSIAFSAAKASGVTALEVHNASTSQTLAGGVGEAGLADLGLDIFV